MKNVSFKLYSDQWGAKVVLFIGDRDSFVLCMKEKYHFHYAEEWNANVCGLSCRMIAASDGHVTGYVIWMPDFAFVTDDYVVLSHECIHTAGHILNDRGVFYGDDAKEALTYTCDFIYRIFLKRLHKFYHKSEGGKPCRKK